MMVKTTRLTATTRTAGKADAVTHSPPHPLPHEDALRVQKIEIETKRYSDAKPATNTVWSTNTNTKV